MNRGGVCFVDMVEGCVKAQSLMLKHAGANQLRSSRSIGMHDSALACMAQHSDYCRQGKDSLIWHMSAYESPNIRSRDTMRGK